MLYYILLSRTDSSSIPAPNESAELWQSWLAGEKADRELGWRVGGRLGERLRTLEEKGRNVEMVTALRDNVQDRLDEVREIVRQAGISTFGTGWIEELRRRLNGTTSPALLSALSGLKKQIERIEELSQPLHGEEDQSA
jgi:hypothetical protein